MAIYETGDNFREKGFAPLVLKGSKYLYTSAQDLDTPEEEHVGQMRISFSYAPCGKGGKASVCAQLIKDNEGEFTFRQWNPGKRNVPYDTPTEQIKEPWQTATWAWIFCCLPICINKHCCRKEGQGTIEVYYAGEYTSA